MKRWKQCALLVLILITGIIYGSGKLIVALEKNKPKVQADIPKDQEKSYGFCAKATKMMEDIHVFIAEEQAKRKFQRVELDYLKDALFIGDSRTDTLYLYSGWRGTDFFSKTGLTIWTLWDNEVNGRYLSSMLEKKQYGKIYIMLGVNEVGDGDTDSFVRQYKSVLDKIQEKQPNAIIFIQAIMHVSPKVDAQGGKVNNLKINLRNQGLCTLADQKTIFWLDANEVFDEPGTGMLDPKYSFDGVHLRAKYVDIWQEYLLDHGIQE